jgi:hypothetical protein
LFLAKLSRLQGLSAREWRWLAASLALLPAAALSIRVTGWTSTMSRAGRWMRCERRLARAGCDPAIVARVVRIAATYGPYRATCLPRAIVLWGLLRREGFEPVVAMGVRKGARGVEAHAWVELEGVTFDQTADSGSFVPLQPPRRPLQGARG